MAPKIDLHHFDERFRFHDARVLVVGDLMLDRYLFGEVDRISQEAPVPIVRRQRETENLGGAGNVARNLAGLGLTVRVAGLIGEDIEGDRVLKLLLEARINTESIVRQASRPTTTKTRVTKGGHQLLRIDVEETSTLPEEVVHRLVENVRANHFPEAKAILLSDYAKGVVSPQVAQGAIGAGRRLGVPVLVDPKGPNWDKYRGATMASPNRIELAEATGVSAADLDGLLAAGEQLRRKLAFDFLAVTLGELGIVLLEENGMHRFPSVAREVFDVSGAGDTVIATLAAALIAGMTRHEAVQLANLAAGVVVGRSGTAPIELEQLREAVARSADSGYLSKICSVSEAADRAEDWRRRGHRVVFTNGCFDLLHAGHTIHLAEARKLGTRLIIGLNSDRSIKGLKGESRPIQNQRDRAILLACLAAVDAVVIFDESNPLQLVLAIRPDVMVKGNDYAKEAIAGAAEVESWGGEVVTLPLIEGRSTSAIIERIRGGDFK